MSEWPLQSQVRASMINGESASRTKSVAAAKTEASRASRRKFRAPLSSTASKGARVKVPTVISGVSLVRSASPQNSVSASGARAKTARTLKFRSAQRCVQDIANSRGEGRMTHATRANTAKFIQTAAKAVCAAAPAISPKPRPVTLAKYRSGGALFVESQIRCGTQIVVATAAEIHGADDEKYPGPSEDCHAASKQVAIRITA